MIYSFNRRRDAQGCLGCVGVFLIGWFLMFGLVVIPADQWGFRLMAIIGAAAIAFMMSPMYIDLFAKNPILTISDEGVYFQLYSEKTIRWPDIESVTIRRGYWQSGKGKYATYTPYAGADSLSFRVRTPSFYPNRRGVLGMERKMMEGAGMDVPINTVIVAATAPDLIKAFETHCKDKIREIPVPETIKPDDDWFL